MLLVDYYQKMLHPVVEKPNGKKKSGRRGRSKKRDGKRHRGGRRGR